MNKTLVALLLSAFASFAPSAFAIDACPAVSGGSCLITTQFSTTCLDAITNTIPLQVLQAQCGAASGVFATTSCPTTNMIGSCVLNNQGREGVIMRMYAPLTIDQLNAVCTQSHSRVCQ